MTLLVDFHVHFWLLLSKRAHLKGSSAKKGTSTEIFGRANAPFAPCAPEALEIEFNGNDVVSKKDLSLRISLKTLSLRDNFQKEKHIRESNPVFILRGQGSQLVDGHLNQAKDVLKQLEKCADHYEEVDSMNKKERKLLQKDSKLDVKNYQKI